MNISLFLKYLEINGYSVKRYESADDNNQYVVNKKTIDKFSLYYLDKRNLTLSFGFVLYEKNIYYLRNVLCGSPPTLYFLLEIFNGEIRHFSEFKLYYEKTYDNYYCFEQKYLPIMRQFEKELIESRWHPTRIKKWLESNKDKDVGDYEYLYAAG
jgi:hypothetical protein